MNLSISISPDIQIYMEGLGISHIVLPITSENNETFDLVEVMKILYEKYPDLSAALSKRQRKPRIMTGCIRNTLSI